MGLIKKIKEKKRESQIKRFYNYIDNAKYDLKRAINIEEAEFRYVKILFPFALIVTCIVIPPYYSQGFARIG